VPAARSANVDDRLRSAPAGAWLTEPSADFVKIAAHRRGV
jgi:hypothetical protein